jgi:hypothetical protein
MFRRVREAARAFYDTYPSSDLNARCGGHGQRRRRRRRSTVRSRRLRVRVATSPRVLTMVSTRALLQSRRRPGSTNALVAAVFFSTFCSVRPTAAVDFLTTVSVFNTIVNVVHNSYGGAHESRTDTGRLFERIARTRMSILYMSSATVLKSSPTIGLFLKMPPNSLYNQ